MSLSPDRLEQKYDCLFEQDDPDLGYSSWTITQLDANEYLSSMRIDYLEDELYDLRHGRKGAVSYTEVMGKLGEETEAHLLSTKIAHLHWVDRRTVQDCMVKHVLSIPFIHDVPPSKLLLVQSITITIYLRSFESAGDEQPPVASTEEKMGLELKALKALLPNVRQAIVRVRFVTSTASRNPSRPNIEKNALLLLRKMRPLDYVESIVVRPATNEPNFNAAYCQALKQVTEAVSDVLSRRRNR